MTLIMFKRGEALNISDLLERRVLVQISTEGLIGEDPLNYEQISIYKALLDCGEW